MSESLDHEIRTLQSLFWSERDPDGLAFAPLADAFLRDGKVKEALDLLAEGTARQPEYATGHVIATRLYFEQGMHSEAEFAARRVLELDPENIVALSSLASIVEEQGEADEVERLRSVLVDVDPDADEARVFADVADSGALIDELDSEPVPTLDGAKDLNEDDAGTGPEVMDLGALAPDVAAESEPEVMDLGALAPDVDADPEREVMDLGALAPDVDADPEPEVMDLGALAPDVDAEPEPEVMDLGALAPDVDAEPEPEVMDLGALAPDVDADPEPEVMDLGALAPDVDAAPEPEVIDLGALAPDEVLDLSELLPDSEGEDDSEADADEPVYTRTLAELYVKQGFVDQALNVYRHLLSVEPDVTGIAQRISELESGAGEAAPEPEADPPSGDEPRPEGSNGEEEVETLARDLAESGNGDHEVDTPFAWAEDATPVSAEETEGGPGIGDYFDGLLGWDSRAGS